MKKIYLLLLLSTFQNYFGQNLIKSSKEEFNNSNSSISYNIDKNILIQKDKLVLNNSFTLKNSYSDENYYEYKYLGSFGKLNQFALIEKLEYNGSKFYIFNKDKKTLKDIYGRPYLFENVLITQNVETTTDNKNVLSVFNVNKLQLTKKIDLKNIIVQDLKIFSNYIFIKDINKKYWKIKFK